METGTAPCHGEPQSVASRLLSLIQRGFTMTFLEAAREVLGEAGEPLNAGEIVRRATAAGLLETSGKTPANTLYAQLMTTSRRQGEASEFVLVSRGKWALRKQVGVAAPRVAEVASPAPERVPAHWFLTTNPQLYDIEEVLSKGKETWGQVLRGTVARKRM